MNSVPRLSSQHLEISATKKDSKALARFSLRRDLCRATLISPISLETFYEDNEIRIIKFRRFS